MALAPIAAWPAAAVLLLEVSGQHASMALGPFSFTSGHEGLSLVAISITLWLALLPYARGWADKPHAPSLVGWLLATLGAHQIALLAADLLTFYLGFALTSLAAWGLILQGSGSRVRQAAVTYMVLMLLAELGLLVGLAAVAVSGDYTPAASADGRLQGLPLMLFGAGCAIKLGMLGVHGWLPLAHGSAPLPASALLSGLLVKLGLLAWLHASGDIQLPETGHILIWIGALGAAYGAVAGLLEHAPKRILAFSTVSQMGLVTVAVGALLRAEGQPPDAVLDLAVHHALHKGLAFLALGLMISPRTRLLGLGALGWVLVSIGGAPFTSGATAKHGLEMLLQQAELALLPGLLTLSSVLSAMLLGHLLRQAWSDSHADRKRHAVAVSQWLPVAVLLAAALGLPALLQQGWQPGLLWPLLAALPGWLWSSTGLQIERGGQTAARAWLPSRWPRLAVRLERHLQRWELMGRWLLILGGMLLATLWLTQG